MNFIFKPK